MKEKIKQFVKNIELGNGHAAKIGFESIMREKIRNSIEEKKIEVAKKIYSNNLDKDS